MGSWAKVVRSFEVLAADCRQGRPLGESWEAFVAAARELESRHPPHMELALGRLNALAAERGGRSKVAILDHGTGTAINLLYLAALGFTDIYGANVVPKAQPQNRVFRECMGISEDRIFVYSGMVLPFSDERFDVVLSQQVLEHVPDGALHAYYEEEGRVLRHGGWALHHVPHRGMPYDGHTRTWFLHWLPASMGRILMSRFAVRPEQVDTYLFLRQRACHLKLARRYIGATEDLTLWRALNGQFGANDREDGLYASLRRLGMAIIRLPSIGRLAASVLRPLSMLETVSVKPESPNKF